MGCAFIASCVVPDEMRGNIGACVLVKVVVFEGIEDVEVAHEYEHK